MKPARPLRNTIAEWTVTALIMVWASTNVAWPFVVPTGSMESTVLTGDHVIVDKLAYSPSGTVSRYLLPYQDVRRGDIVVFRFPLQMQENYVKRVIGMPGDRIRIENKQLFLNGKAVAEPYKQHVSETILPYRDQFPGVPFGPVSEEGRLMIEQHTANGALIVPAGRYFVLGDNRDDSWDSRYWGFVPRENIVGKPWIIYWSYEAKPGALKEAVNLDHLADLALNFFSKTRWDRTLRVVRGHPLE